MRLFLFILIILSLFSGCSGISTGSEKKEIPEEKCGNGIVDEGEECDFKDTFSCGDYSTEMIGPLKCDSCKLNKSGCMRRLICAETMCSHRGICAEGEYNNLLYCKCNTAYGGHDCSICSGGYHLDFDGRCISDEKCTLLKCDNYSVCRISGRKAVCICEEPYAGENCDTCMDGYELVNKVCKGYYCDKSGLKCSEFEKCDDTDGVPRCICKGPNQNPYNCSECVQGFDWYFGQCRNKLKAYCSPNPNKPENSVDIQEIVEIEYSEITGWSEPSACKWECIQDTFLFEGKCLEIELFYSTEPHFQFGFDDNGSFIAGNSSGTVFVIDDLIKQRIETGIPFTNGRLGADGNIYFRTEKGFGVLNYETETYFYLNHPGIPENQLTMTMDGTVFYGDSYFSFPDLISVMSEKKNREAVTVSDKLGNTLTVYQDGTLVFLNEKKEILWSKEFTECTFSKYPAISTFDVALLPCFEEDSKFVKGLAVYLNDGSLITSHDFHPLSELKYVPAVSIDSDYRKFVCEMGVLEIFESDNQLVFETSSIYNWRKTEAINPVISDKGFIYFVNGNSILALREADKRMWNFELAADTIPKTLIHKNNRLYVFTSTGELYILTAPGNPEGKWPHALHDSQLSGSIAYLPEFTKPNPVILLFPEDKAVKETNSVTFSWETDSEDPETKHTLLLRDSSGYDKVYAGPETNLSMATVDNLFSGTYEWRVVSQSPKGVLNISEKRVFEIK